MTASVREFFFDSPEDAVRQLTGAVRSGDAAHEVRGALGDLPATGKNAVVAEVGKVAAGVLEMDVGDIFTVAWGKHADLRRAAAASLAEPDGEQVVGLATHTVSFAQEPGVAVHLAGHPVATVTLLVQLDIEVRGLLAVVKAGRLTAVRLGAGDLTGKLTLAGRLILSRSRTIDLPRAINLRDGIALTA